MHCDTARVVTPVFKSFETFYKYWCDVTLRDRANNSAHAYAPLVLKGIAYCAPEVGKLMFYFDIEMK